MKGMIVIAEDLWMIWTKMDNNKIVAGKYG